MANRDTTITLLIKANAAQLNQALQQAGKEDLSASVPLGAFASLDSCRDSAHSAIRSLMAAEERTRVANPDYEPLVQDWECGYKCKAQGDGDGDGLNVCERTDK